MPASSLCCSRPLAPRQPTAPDACILELGTHLIPAPTPHPHQPACVFAHTHKIRTCAEPMRSDSLPLPAASGPASSATRRSSGEQCRAKAPVAPAAAARTSSSSPAASMTARSAWPTLAMVSGDSRSPADNSAPAAGRCGAAAAWGQAGHVQQWTAWPRRPRLAIQARRSRGTEQTAGSCPAGHAAVGGHQHTGKPGEAPHQERASVVGAAPALSHPALSQHPPCNAVRYASWMAGSAVFAPTARSARSGRSAASAAGYSSQAGGAGALRGALAHWQHGGHRTPLPNPPRSRSLAPAAPSADGAIPAQPLTMNQRRSPPQPNPPLRRPSRKRFGGPRSPDTSWSARMLMRVSWPRFAAASWRTCAAGADTGWG